MTEIPEGLFDNNTKVTRFSGAFQNCTGLTNIPEGLFDKCTEVTTFSSAFSGTSVIVIPNNLFLYNTKVKEFNSTFYGCSGLLYIPLDLFDKCVDVKSFYKTFYKCGNLSIESPYTVISVDGEDVKVHLYERSNYPEYFTTPTSNLQCFYNCTGLTDYSSIPSDWK